jgi:hypothetical protein
MPPSRGGLGAGLCAGGGQEPAGLESGETAGDQGGPDDTLAARLVTGAPNAEPPDLRAGGCSPRVCL